MSVPQSVSQRSTAGSSLDERRQSRGFARRAGVALLPYAAVALLALTHSLLYAWLIPPWQIPDEPSQFEYAALIGVLGRVPSSSDADPALEARLLESLMRERFFEHLTGRAPDPPPRSMDQARELFFMPRQVGHDPPLYFLLTALPIAALAGQSIERQLLAVRALGAFFTAGAALCAYGAGRELFAGGSSRYRTWAGGFWGGPQALPKTSPSLSDEPKDEKGTSFGRSSLVLGPPAVGLAVALQPMLAFVGAGAGDDTLANLVGAALCWASVRAARRGLSPLRLAVVLALALLGLLTKRTMLPWAVLLALAGIGIAIRRLVRAPIAPAARAAIGAVALVALAGGAWAALAAGRDERTARNWVDSIAITGAPRVPRAPGSDGPALEVHAGRNAIQGVPLVAMEWAQNQELRASARVWTAGGPARGRLAIDYGWVRVEAPFDAGGTPRVVDVHTLLPLYCPSLAIGIFVDQGAVYADRIGAASDRQPGVPLLDNGDLSAPGIRDGAPAERLRQALRLRELAWGWRSGWLRGPPPLGWALGRIFFASFWGQFGWMSLPIVAGAPWERALWLVCGGGLIGALAWLAGGRGADWRRRAVGLLLAGPAIGLVFPLLNAYTQPRSQAIQQGRYLLPMLAPIVLLLVLGWGALMPPRWRRAGLVAWAGWWVLFAITALALLLSVYDPRFSGLHHIFL